MLQKIIKKLPEDYPSWALRNVLRGFVLPSHSEEQVEWNKAVGKAAAEEWTRLYIRSEDHIAAWNCLEKAEGHINSQQTVHLNAGQVYAMEIIENLRDALALEPGLSWPDPFPPVYTRRAFWTDQVLWDEDKKGFGTLRREAGDPRWFLTILGNQCPHYFLLETLTRRKVQLEVKPITILDEDKDRFDAAYEYIVRRHDGKVEYRGEVDINTEQYTKKHYFARAEQWHIPRDMSNVEMVYWGNGNYCRNDTEGVRQGDKFFLALQKPPIRKNDDFRIRLNPDLAPFGRHTPDPAPYGYGFEKDWRGEKHMYYVFSKPPVIRHPEHPTIRLEGCYVRVTEVPGGNMYLGEGGPTHD